MEFYHPTTAPYLAIKKYYKTKVKLDESYNKIYRFYIFATFAKKAWTKIKLCRLVPVI